DDLPLFRALRQRPAPPPESPAEALLREIRPDELPPREALDLHYRLQGLIAQPVLAARAAAAAPKATTSHGGADHTASSRKAIRPIAKSRGAKIALTQTGR